MTCSTLEQLKKFYKVKEVGDKRQIQNDPQNAEEPPESTVASDIRWNPPFCSGIHKWAVSMHPASTLSPSRDNLINTDFLFKQASSQGTWAKRSLLRRWWSITWQKVFIVAHGSLPSYPLTTHSVQLEGRRTCLLRVLDWAEDMLRVDKSREALA